MSSHLTDQPALDWLRFVLASIVVLGHAGFDFPDPIDGGLAVWVFLALSGWLIGGILLRTSPEDLPRFYYNRAVRIWIPYFIAVLLLYSVAAAKEGIDANWWKYLFYDLTFTHYNFTVFPQAVEEMPLDGTGNHFWSLAVEEQFYLVAPLMLTFASLGWRVIAGAIFLAVVVFVADAFQPIAGGVLAAIIQKRWGNWHLTRVGYAAVISVMLVSLGLLRGTESTLIETAFAVSVVLILSVPGRRSRCALWFGAISFPLYLNGWIGMFAANFLTNRVAFLDAASIWLQFLLAVVAATVCWYLIDRPLRANRERWYGPRVGRVAAATAYATVGLGIAGGLLIMSFG